MIQSKCPYGKCDGSGLIPFMKEGKLISNCWTHCDCHYIYGLNPEPEHYHPVSIDDYDFPMSETFRGWTYQYCGVPDPSYIPLERELQGQEIKPVFRPRPVDKEIDQLKVGFLHLQNKLNSHLDKSKKPQPVKLKKGEKSKYKDEIK